MKKAEKTTFVKNLAENLKSATSIVLVDYAGLNVKAQQNLKKRLKEVGATILVTKNTLLALSGKEAKLDPEMLTDSVLSGQTAAVTTTGDPIAAVQTLGKFTAEFQVPKFKVGIVEGGFHDSQSLLAISRLPSRESLFSKLLGTLMAQNYALVSTLQANSQKLVYLLASTTK